MRPTAWKPRPDPEIALGEQSPVFNRVTALLGPLYSRFVLRLNKIEVEGEERLIEEYRRASRDEGRFIIAYRHPGDADPHLVYHVLTDLLAGKAPATAPDGRPGAWYPSGSEVQLWASPLVLWALRNAGIVPVKHGGVDRAALDFLVRGVAEKRRPMAIAPEGMATYHRDALFELDPGTSRIASLAAERLAASEPPMGLRILPVAIEYSFADTTSPARLSRFVSSLERRAGLDTPPLGPARDRHKERILAVWERIVALTEAAYYRAWGIKPAAPGLGLRERTLALLDASIARLEAFYGVSPSANLKSRVLNIRAESLDRVFYPPGELATMPPLARRIAERGATEAFSLDQVYLAAAIGQFLDPEYIAGDPPFDRLVETAQNLYDLSNRLEGWSMRKRSRYFLKDACVVVGEPIDVARREGESRREAADRVNRELADGLRTLIRY